jgi:hypothetical protein
LEIIIAVFTLWVVLLIIFALRYANDVYPQEWAARIFSLAVMTAAFIFYGIIHGGFWIFFSIFPMGAVSLAWFYGRFGGIAIIIFGIIGVFPLTSISRIYSPEIVPAYVLVPLYFASGILHIIIAWRSGKTSF